MPKDYHTSSFSRLAVFEWCRRCECFLHTFDKFSDLGDILTCDNAEPHTGSKAAQPAPAEVWHKQAGVQDEAHSVIHWLPLAECLVAALVSYHPNACPHGPLHVPQLSSVCIRNLFC